MAATFACKITCPSLVLLFPYRRGNHSRVKSYFKWNKGEIHMALCQVSERPTTYPRILWGPLSAVQGLPSRCQWELSSEGGALHAKCPQFNPPD